jgi:flagellar basal-body rod protein FlgF
MSNAISDAVRGALYQEMRLSVLSNNLANINTIGFKKDNIVFTPDSDVTYDDPQSPGLTDPAAAAEFMMEGLPARTFIDFSAGHIEATGNTLDMALNSDGFFCVETPDGTQYTRKGNFKLNENSELCTQEGYPVLGEGGKITVSDASFSVDASGDVQSGGSTVDTIKIANFKPDSLYKSGNGFFVKNNEDVREIPVDDKAVSQGYVEQSNVNAVNMMTQMIDTLRGFESYQKIIQYLNETNSKSISELGQTA